MKKLFVVIAACALALCFAPAAFADEEMVAQNSDPVKGELEGFVYASALAAPSGNYVLKGDTELMLDVDAFACSIFDPTGQYKLTITGDSMLTVSGGTMSTGISTGSIELAGGNVQVLNGSNNFECGIQAKQDFVMTGGDVYVEGNMRGVNVGGYCHITNGYLETNSNGVGLWANGENGYFKMTGGTLSGNCNDMLLFAADIEVAPDVFDVRYPSHLKYDLNVPVSIVAPLSGEKISGYTFFDGGKKAQFAVIGGYTPMTVTEIPFEGVVEKLATGSQATFTAAISDVNIGSNKAADFVSVYKEKWVDVVNPRLELNSSEWYMRPAVAGHSYEYCITFKAAKNLVFSNPLITYKGKNISSSVVKEVSEDGHFLTIFGLFKSGEMYGFDRLSGEGALQTMYNIVKEGDFTRHGTIVLASVEGYWDALTAAGVAGLYDAPVVMTYGTELDEYSYELISDLLPETIIVCGGKATISDDVVAEAEKAAGTNPTVKRFFGSTATGTARDIYEKGVGWKDDTALIATVGTFQDALAAAPIAFAKEWPIFLAEYDWATGKGVLANATIDAMKKGGIKNVYIVGGEYWISKDVEKQLASNGITLKKRLAGETAVETSSMVAVQAIAGAENFGMTPNGLGVASSQVYQDALAGAALCGIHNAPLILVLDEKSSTINYVKGYQDDIDYGHVFGGITWVSQKTFDALNEARAKG